MRTHTVIDSVVGDLTIVADDGQIRCLYMDLQRHRPDDDELGEPDPRGREAEPFKAAADQLDAYFAGELTTFDLPLAPRGSEFQQRVWGALQEIPYGSTESYGELAERIGSPGAARARRLGEWEEPHRHRHPVPSRRGLKRQPHRLRRRPGPKEEASRSRTGGQRGCPLLEAQPGWLPSPQ